MNDIEFIPIFVGISEYEELVYAFQLELSKIIDREIIGEFTINPLEDDKDSNGLVVSDSLKFKDFENELRDFGYCTLKILLEEDGIILGYGSYSYLGELISSENILKAKALKNVFKIFLLELIKRSDLIESSDDITIKASISGLASVIAHEVKTPLQFMLSKVQTMKYKYDDKDITADMKEIENEIVRVSDLVHELLSIAKFTLSDDNIVVQNLVIMINEAISLLTKEALRNQININLEVKDSVLNVQISPVVIKQVIMSIVNNSIYALKQTEMKVINIILYGDNSGNAVIVIKDNGTGISQSNIGRIFKKGFSTKKEDGGSGLGLYAVRLFVKSIGGSIDVFSENGKGTSFVIKIPLR